MEDSSSESFAFAFNDPAFSDRVLHIQLSPDEQVSSPPKSKKPRLTISPPQAQITNVSDSCVVFQHKTLYVNSAILAAKSPFFFQLFKNGMTESQHKEATLKIVSSEEKALMDLLKFMYTNTLSATTCSDLVDVLMAAERFQVKSCVKCCMGLLLEMPMSLESALLYLDLPSSALPVEPLIVKIDASKRYLAAHFKDFHDHEEEAMKLPLAALEIVLGSEGLIVGSEDAVYEFILRWARANYPEQKERREILTNRMERLICFEYMSCCKLKEVLVCPDFYCTHVYKLVMKALFNKAEGSSKYFTTTKTRRLYCNRLVKVVPLEFALPRCVIYFNLKKDECRTMFPSNAICSEDILVGGELIFLEARSEKGSSSSEHFSVFLYMAPGRKTCTCTFDIEWAVMKKPLNGYEVEIKGNNHIITNEEGTGWDLFEIPWTKFISDDSKYFIDDVLHLRAEITIIKIDT